jgi:T5orf172 domain
MTRPPPRLNKAGWVYALQSSQDPRVIKIGKTTQSRSQRQREVEQSEGYRQYGPYTLVHSVAAFDCTHVETTAHRMLKDRRLKAHGQTFRELFVVDIQEAATVVSAARDALTGWRPRRHRSPRRSQQSGAWAGRSSRSQTQLVPRHRGFDGLTKARLQPWQIILMHQDSGTPGSSRLT